MATKATAKNAAIGLTALVSLVNFVRTNGSLGDLSDAQIVEYWAKSRSDSEQLRKAWEAANAS